MNNPFSSFHFSTSKYLLLVFALVGLLFMGLYQKPLKPLIVTQAIHSQSSKATLICKLDEQGSLWSLSESQNADPQAWQRIWPDQLSTVIHDEKSLHKDKALISLSIDPSCPFSRVWKLLEVCTKEELSICLKESAP